MLRCSGTDLSHRFLKVSPRKRIFYILLTKRFQSPTAETTSTRRGFSCRDHS